MCVRPDLNAAHRAEHVAAEYLCVAAREGVHLALHRQEERLPELLSKNTHYHCVGLSQSNSKPVSDLFKKDWSSEKQAKTELKSKAE